VCRPVFYDEHGGYGNVREADTTHQIPPRKVTFALEESAPRRGRQPRIFKDLLRDKRLLPTLVMVGVALMVAWMGDASGGYFVGGWAPVAIFLAMLLLVASVGGMFFNAGSRWSVVAGGLFAAYAGWTLLSLYWSPNRGDAWVGAGLTLLYLLGFCITVTFVALGARRRWVLAACSIGPAVIAGLTLLALGSRTGNLFENGRLLGSVGYYNGEAAFLLVSFWVAVYLAGSRSVHPILRSLVLAGAVLSLCVAVLTQSRGAMVAMLATIPVFFLLSGQRLRGFLALVPVVGALLVAFPGLNDVYLAFPSREGAGAALDQVIPTVWLAAVGAGVYGFLWGLIDRRWRPPVGLVRAVGGVVLAISIVVVALAAFAFDERVGSPVAWGAHKWEAFKNSEGSSGQEQTRYLSASSSGRYTLWKVAWEDFASHPILGVGTHNYEATYYRLREEPAGYVRQPHMLPLEVLGERGIVGGVLFFGILATCGAAGLWKRFTYLGSEGKAQIGALGAAVAYWFVHSSADWFWQMPAVTLPAVVYLAMLVAPWGAERRVTLPRWPQRSLGVGLAVIVMVTVTPLYIADRYLALGEATASPWIALQYVERAQTFAPVDPLLPQREAELALRTDDWSRAEESYRRAIQLNPEHYAPYELLARFYEERGQPAKALPLYRKASDLNPLDKGIQRRVARLQAQTSDSGSHDDGAVDG
jgi:hypothetical protein